MDLYQVLGVRRDASEDEIKKAYRKIARENHPDKFPDDTERVARFKQATDAYGTLGDAAKRANYDRERKPAASVPDLLARSVGAQVLAMILPHAPAARRDGGDQILTVPVDEGFAQIPDRHDPDRTLDVSMPRVHQLCCVEDHGTEGHAGGSTGNLYLVPQNQKESM